jgi:NAD-dependent DNA ligase
LHFSEKTTIIYIQKLRKTMKILAPKNCPSCGSTLKRVKDQLFCLEKDTCPAQSSKRVQNFCKKLKIKGFGESTLEKVGITDINELLALRPARIVDSGMSEHMANKLVNTISTKLDEGISPNDFLAAMSIPMIGDGAMRKLQFSNITEITYDMCREAGIGDKAAKSLVEWIDQEYEKYVDWSSYFKITKSQTPKVADKKPEVVCITGKLDNFKNRAEATRHLESLGYTVKTSVTKDVTHLVCEDETKKSSSSYKKALNNNIIITTIKELLEDSHDKN